MTANLTRQTLLQLIDSVHPRGIEFKVKSNCDLQKFVDDYWLPQWGSPTTYVEKIYYAAYQKIPFCDKGNRLGWASLSKGSVWCASHCSCAQQQRHQSLVDNFGPNYNELIQQKIKRSLKEKYGTENLWEANAEGRTATNLAKYGAATPLQNPTVLQKTRDSYKAKTGVSFVFQNPAVRNAIQNRWQSLIGKKSYVKSSQQIKQARDQQLVDKFGDKAKYLLDRDLFVGQLRLQSRAEFANMIGCSHSLIDKRIAEWDLTEFQQCNSHYETVISRFLDHLGVEYETRNRKIITPLELDWWIPSHKIGIEFCGLRWHGERVGRDRSYHLTKLARMRAIDCDLIQIFQDEWDQKSEIIKSIIANRLHLGGGQSVMARKCKLVEVSQTQLEQFLTNNHLYGTTIGDKVKLGLVYDQQLVAVMSFRKHKKIEWEISRFAVAANVTVQGGFSKLFASFVDQHKPKQVISYVDLRYFTGHSLSKAGFEYNGSTSPGYWWTKGVIRYHRLNFTKAKLAAMGFDIKQTESAIMFAQNYDRIWDCGHDRWIWNYQ